MQDMICVIRRNDSPARSSPKDVLAEEGPKNDSRSRPSGTGLTIKRRPAECTTCAAMLGGRTIDKIGLKSKTDNANLMITNLVIQYQLKQISSFKEFLLCILGLAIAGICWFTSYITYNNNKKKTEC